MTADVPVEALLCRKVVEVGDVELGGYLAGATVLVTGAGGSVGAELCLRLTRLGVGKLVLVDQAEAPLVGVVRMLEHEPGVAPVVAVLADIRSRVRMIEVFESHRPDAVFHTAAYKHVPLLEHAPVEAVAANVFGTKCVVDAAQRVGVPFLVLCSTDKAVQPTSVLGQTKRVAEWLVAAAARREASRGYASVRLVNVVDSAGSILPFFREQIARGGPVTVTHPEATRYLITAGEAAGLAVAAGGLADPDGVFWLDPGPPLSMLELARRLASSDTREVEIEFVGLRPGERLHERLFADADAVVPTRCEHVWSSPAEDVDPEWLEGWLSVLARHVRRGLAEGARSALAEMLATPQRRFDEPSVALAG